MEGGWCGSGKTDGGGFLGAQWVDPCNTPPSPRTKYSPELQTLGALSRAGARSEIHSRNGGEIGECSQVRVHPKRGLFRAPASSLPSGSVEPRTARMDPFSRAAMEPDAVLKNWLGVLLLRLPAVQTYFKLETVTLVIRICMVWHCTQ